MEDETAYEHIGSSGDNRKVKDCVRHRMWLRCAGLWAKARQQRVKEQVSDEKVGAAGAESETWLWF